MPLTDFNETISLIKVSGFVYISNSNILKDTKTKILNFEIEYLE